MSKSLNPNHQKKSVIIKSKEQFEKKFIAASEVIYNSLKSFCEQQKKYGENHSNYVLGIQTISEDKNTKTLTVTYACDISATPLSTIKYSSPKHKIQIFKHLYLIYGFLNKQKILHRNLKPNNIIFYNQQLLLTDFGYMLGDWQIDKINFLDENDGVRNDNMYPYLSPEVANMIVSTKSYGHKMDALKKRYQKSVKQQDQFAIAIMMLEVFITFNDKKLTTANQRLKQINEMTLSDEFSNEVEKFIKETIISILYYKDFDETEFDKKLQMIIEIEQQTENYKINKQELMTQEYDDLVKQVLENKDTQFNLKLLYHFSKTDLNCLLINIQKKYEENKELIEEMKRLLHLYQKIKNLSLNTTEEQFTNEDLFISLVYLDEKIESYQNSQNQEPYQIMSENEQKYRHLKQSLKKEYIRLNNLNKNEFKFNNIFGKDIEIMQLNSFKANEDQQIKDAEMNHQSHNDVIQNDNDNVNNQQNEQQPNESDQQNLQQPNESNQKNFQQPNESDQQNFQQPNENEQNQQLQNENNQLNVQQHIDGQQSNSYAHVDIDLQQPNQILTLIYTINEQTSQQKLLEAIKSNFNNTTLQIYFEINKCFCQKIIQGYVYKYKNDPNVICLGEIKGNDFEGEVMQLEVKKVNNNKTIFHYINVKITLNNWNIEDKEQKSSIFYY